MLVERGVKIVYPASAREHSAAANALLHDALQGPATRWVLKRDNLSINQSESVC